MTALGLNNYGKQVYRYGLEDIDVDEKGEEVFRESDSTFFCRIRDLFPNELKTLYNTLESKNAWHAESFLNKIDAWQNEFPEELWRIDIERKYLRTYNGSFINGKGDAQFLVNMANGKMKYYIKQWERSQEKYMASKYQSSVASSDNSVFRCSVPSGELAVAPNYRLKLTPYAYMYLNVKYGTQNPIQMRAEPNKVYEIPFDGEKADIVDVYSASLIRDFGDLSTCYVATADTSKAEKVKVLQFGNDTEGYDNPNFTTLTTGANYLLETLNIENVSGLTQSLNLSALKNLKELYAHGSNIGGVTFADGGRIEIAELPAISAMSLKNLIYLTDLNIADLNKLTTLTVENCDTVDLEYILDNAPNINRIRIAGIDWSLDNTDMLDRLYGMAGIDKDGYNIDRSVVMGSVHIPIIQEFELLNYKTAWPDLEITYNTLVKQYSVTFINPDGTVLDIQYVTEGEKPVDPITRAENPIETPTMESTVSTDFTFEKWDSNFVAAFENITITAVYTETLRNYTIQYVSNGQTLQTTVAPYGDTVWYEGETPVLTSEEHVYRYYLFNGWDKSGYVSGDKTINAVFDTCKYTSDYFDGKDLSEMRPVEIYAMTKLADAGIGFDISNYVESKDAITVTLGNDISFEDVEQAELITEPVTLDGSTVVDTGINLFEEDRDFVLAIDYTANSGNTNGNVFAQCYSDNGMSGFKIWYNGGVKLGWGSDSMTPSTVGNREMVVIRHIKGEYGLHVYSSNTGGDTSTYIELAGEHAVNHSSPLVFGCSRSDDGSYEKYSKGTVYWSKLWYADLGEDTCSKLAAWPHEEIKFEMCGFKRYFISDNSNKRASMSFIAADVLSRPMALNSESSSEGGWAAMALNAFLNNRVYNAFPIEWKQLLKQVSVKSSAGNKSTAIVSADCYIAIPALIELDATKVDDPYINEGTAIDFFTDKTSRICYDKNGNAVSYWTRSPYATQTSYVYAVNTTGTFSGYTYPDQSHHVRMIISI